MVGSKIRHIWVSPIIHVRNAKYVKKEADEGRRTRRIRTIPVVSHPL